MGLMSGNQPAKCDDCQINPIYRNGLCRDCLPRNGKCSLCDDDVAPEPGDRLSKTFCPACLSEMAASWSDWTPPPRKVDVPGQMRLDGATLVGKAWVEGLIDSMARDNEMEPDEIAEELVKCGYDEEEAEQLSLRPWRRDATGSSDQSAS